MPSKHKNINGSYYVRTLRERDDTLWSLVLARPDSTFHLSFKKLINSPLGFFEIDKFTNEPGAPDDGGMELFYEKRIGMFYSRSLTWPEYTRIHYTEDSLNNKISILIDRVLADPDLCNFPVFDTTKLMINKYTPPKIE